MPRRTPWIEVLGLLALVVLTGVLVQPHDPVLTAVHPHLFWVAILLIALRYGHPWGTVTALLSATLYVAGLVLQGFRFQEGLHLGAIELLLPILFLVVGTLVSDRIRGLNERGEHFAQEAREASEARAGVELRLTEMETAYRTLEGQLSEQADSMTSLYDAAKGLEAFDLDEIKTSLLRILSDYLRVESASLWLLTGDDWAWAGGDEASRDHPPALAAAAAREGRTLHAAERFRDADVGPNEGILAGPIPGFDSGCLIVVVHAIPFRCFTERTIRLFRLLMNWAGRSLERRQWLAAARSRDVVDADLGLTSEAFLRVSLAKDMALLERRGEEACLCFLQIPPHVPEVQRQRLHVLVAAVLRTVVRQSDTVAFIRDRAIFALYMPNTGADGGAAALEKVQAALADFAIELAATQAPFQLQAYRRVLSRAGALDALVEEAEAAWTGEGPSCGC